jgi:hypothetical protein
MSGEPAGEKVEGPGRVLRTFLGLAVFLGAAFWVIQHFFVSSVDGAEKQAELFGGRNPPFGLVLAQAVRLPTQDVLVGFERAPDWPAGAGEPLTVSFIEYRSRSALEGLFRVSGGMEGMGPGPGGSQIERWEKTKDFDWHVTRKRDDIAWGPWRSKLLIERSFTRAGTWSEEARVDLSRGERNLVLFAHWPDQSPVDEERLVELLGSIAIVDS